MPKSQVQMAVVYIFSAIVVLIILGFGYMQISESRKTFSEASKLALQAKIKKGIDSMAYQFGSSKEVYYDVSDEIKEMCFSEPKSDPSCIGCQKERDHQTASVFMNDNPSDNVFLVGDSIEGSFKIDKLTTGCCDFVCAKNKANRISFKFVGLGDKTMAKLVSSDCLENGGECRSSCNSGETQFSYSCGSESSGKCCIKNAETFNTNCNRNELTELMQEALNKPADRSIDFKLKKCCEDSSLSICKGVK